MPSPAPAPSEGALIRAQIQCLNAYEALLLAYHGQPGKVRDRRIEQGFEAIEAAALAMGYRLERMPIADAVIENEVAA